MKTIRDQELRRSLNVTIDKCLQYPQILHSIFSQERHHHDTVMKYAQTGIKNDYMLVISFLCSLALMEFKVIGGSPCWCLNDLGSRIRHLMVLFDVSESLRKFPFEDGEIGEVRGRAWNTLSNSQHRGVLQELSLQLMGASDQTLTRVGCGQKNIALEVCAAGFTVGAVEFNGCLFVITLFGSHISLRGHSLLKKRLEVA